MGADALMVKDAEALDSVQEVLERRHPRGGSGGNVLGSRVLTVGGTDLGKVVDVIREVGGGSDAPP